MKTTKLFDMKKENGDFAAWLKDNEEKIIEMGNVFIAYKEREQKSLGRYFR